MGTESDPTAAALRPASDPVAEPALDEAAQPNSKRNTTDWRKGEITLAIRNIAKLGSSLIVSWGIGLVARLYIPRFLGPERFGMLNFADSFAAIALVPLGLGIDTYVRKELPVRPEHASDFVGGIVVLRLLLSVLVFVGMGWMLTVTDRSEEVRLPVYICGVSQFLAIGNLTSAGILQAKGSVNEMSVLQVVSKLLWAGIMASAVFLDLGLWAFASAALFSEALKSGVLFRLARRYVGIQMRIDARATGKVIVASLPFFVTGLASTTYSKLDVSILAVRASDQEVGWYGAATSLAGLTLLLTPILSWVLMPLFAKAAAVSEEELYSMFRRSVEMVMAFAMPIALMMGAGAEEWIGIVFGSAFLPSVQALRVMASVFLLIYVSIICWCALTMLNRTWKVTYIYLAGLVVSPSLNLLLIGPGLRAYGPGGGGIACATAALGTEICLVVPMLILLGKRAFDRRLLRTVSRCALVSLAVIACDVLLRPRIGWLRLPVDVLLYVVLALAIRAVDVKEMIAWIRMAMQRRKEAAPETPHSTTTP